MKTSRTNNRVATVAILAGLLTLVACTPEPASKPLDPAPKPTTSQPAPPPSAEAEPAPAETEPAPPETIAPAETVAADQAEPACLDLQRQEQWTSLTPTGPALVRERASEPIWYVLIPGVNGYGEGYIECFVHSDPSQQGPFVSESSAYLITEEHIQRQVDAVWGEGA